MKLMNLLSLRAVFIILFHNFKIIILKMQRNANSRVRKRNDGEIKAPAESLTGCTYSVRY